MSDSHGDSQHESRLAGALIAATAWIARHPWLTLAFCAATLAVSIELARTSLSYRTQRDDLMSADKACQVRWRHYLEEFGSDDDIVVVIEGADRALMQEAADWLDLRLRREPQLFDRVFSHVDLRHLKNRALLFLDEDEIRTIDRSLQRMSPLLGPAAPVVWHSMTLRSLTARAASIAKNPHQAAASEDDRVFLNQYEAVLAAAEKALQNPPQHVNVWTALSPRPSADAGALDNPRYFFSDDGSLAFLLVRPAKVDRQSFTPVAESVGRARELTRDAAAAFPALSFGLTGLPVLEHDEMDGTDRDSMRAAWLALTGMALLYFFVYRGLRYPLLTVASLLAGTFWALGLTTVTVGHLNILSSAFAVMLIGMGDYGVLWVARFDEERRLGLDIHEALRQTAAHAGPSILTAAVTTSLAFFAIMLADFKAVAELGFIAGSGVLLCALACFVLMPALLVLTQRSPRPGVLPFYRKQSDWMPRALRHPRLVLAATGICLTLGAGFAARLPYDQNLLHLQSQTLESVQWEQKLLARCTGAGWHAISIAATPGQAQQLRHSYEQLGCVSRADEVASLIPDNQPEKLKVIERIADRLDSLPGRAQALRHPRPDTQALLGELKQIGELPGRPLLAERLARFSAILASSESAAREQAVINFERQLTGDLWESLVRLRDSASPAAITIDDLPADLRDRFVGASGKFLVRAFAREDLWAPETLAAFVEQTRNVDPEATGKPFGTLEGLRSMTNGFFHAGLYALMAIVLILAFDFRSTWCVLLALLPLAVGMTLSLGILRIFGGSLNPANLVALPLIVGVGVDNGVHVLHDYRARRNGITYCMSNATGRGILVAALTTIIGFGTLMISRHEGMFGLGLILSLGVTCCMFAALLVLPALLRLQDRNLPTTHPEEAAPARRRAA